MFTKGLPVSFITTIHENNQGALKLSTLEPGRHTPRSKFYALKLHWFRSWLIPKKIGISFIETEKQHADFLTKSMSPIPFKRNRKLSMGW